MSRKDKQLDMTWHGIEGGIYIGPLCTRDNEQGAAPFYTRRLRWTNSSGVTLETLLFSHDIHGLAIKDEADD